MTTHQNPQRKAKNAYFAENDEANAMISKWLDQNKIDALRFSSAQSDEIICLVEDGQFNRIILASAGRALLLPWFDRLLRAVIETDTELWTADDDTEFGLHLFLSMIENWEFLVPYVPEATEGTSLTSVRDSLSRIESRIRTNVACDEASRPDQSCSDEVGRQIEKHGLVVDPEQFTVAYKGQKCFLGNTVLFRLMERLARSPGIFISFNVVKSDVWPEGNVEDATVPRTLRTLRARLRNAGVTGVVLETSREVKHHVRVMLR